jgi:hypothetical protein
VALEHRHFLYASDESSSMECKSSDELHPIEPVNVDQGCQSCAAPLVRVHVRRRRRLGKVWRDNPLQIFTFPHNFTRDQSLAFCTHNNGTLLFWDGAAEYELVQSRCPSG